MSKHTEGPWAFINPDGYVVRHPQIYTDTGPVCNATWLGDGRIEELRSNARLIAAAPELLQALEAVMSQANSTEMAKAFDMARAAISKATGA